jgi:trans-aconitate methyltransferase
MADRWDSSLYEDRHSFVWKKAGALLDLLDPKPGESVLDLGCGTGHLTKEIADRGAETIGLDASASMIAQARQNYPKLKFALGNATSFEFDKRFHAVFSNAVLHWIPEADRVIDCVARALQPGGRFVLEMGGKGNVARIVAALDHVLRGSGYSPKNPWFYPSAAEYSTLLEARGFEVEALWTIERWTKLDHPERGLREWLEMFAGPWFEGIEAQTRDELVGHIEAYLRPAMWRDGHWWADYRRLRIVARSGQCA